MAQGKFFSPFLYTLFFFQIETLKSCQISLFYTTKDINYLGQPILNLYACLGIPIKTGNY